MTDVTPEPILQIATGFMASKQLFTATAIGLFEKLADAPASLEELARRCGIPQRTLRINVDAMVSLGLLERDNDRYRNSAVAARFLSGTTGTDLRPVLRLWDRVSYPLWASFENVVRAGEGQRQFNRFSDEEQRIFSAGVEAASAASADALATKVRFQLSSSSARCRRWHGIVPYRHIASPRGAARHLIRVARGMRCCSSTLGPRTRGSSDQRGGGRSFQGHSSLGL